MKVLFLFLMLIPALAHAGETNCTNIHTVTTSTTYTVVASDCIVKIVNPEETGAENAPVAVFLPAGATGTEFTIEDDSDYSNDYCATYDDGMGGTFDLCNPNGVAIYPDGSDTIYDVLSDTSGNNIAAMAGYYDPISPVRNAYKLTWDGSQWVGTSFNWR